MHRKFGAALLGAAALLLGGQTGAAKNWLTEVALIDGGHRIGNPQAPVRLTEYVSYTCPHCAEFARESGGALDLAFVSPGRVSVEVRHLLRDPVDLTAAMLTNCGAPAKFRQNHAAFMLGQDQWIAPLRTANAAQRQRWTSGPPAARRRAIASDFKFYAIMERRGYTRAEADRCLADEALATRLAETSERDWKRPGITGTPSFAIDGTVLAGTSTWRALELQLAARF
ncbi:MAG: hypothetical protein B7Z08_00715 [Sphingomonadales bacterium 32-68-7]|nr:MAG: hypothetical protein B7Z33_12690 [Sphingomonadales bacterium 12-68-11]OYX10489.1 MAG: hypothetical protein B7Z08_00715 [Sphingomonadales bacterium 32-68-7]